MNLLNHAITPNGQPMFPANVSGTQDAFQQPPFAPSQNLKPFHPNPSKTTSPMVTSADSTKGGSTYKFPSSALNIEFEPLALRFMCPPSEKQDQLSDAMVELDAKFATGPNVAVLDVTVSSAVKLDDTQTELIAQKMQRLTGFRNLRLENIVDTSLIAGFVISYGVSESHVIDLSVKGQLAMLAAKIESSDERRIGNNGQSWNFSE